MPSNNQEHLTSPNISSISSPNQQQDLPQNPNHQQFQNLNISPRIQEQNAALQGNNTPNRDPQQQKPSGNGSTAEHNKNPQNYPQQKFNEANSDIQLKITADDLKNFCVAFTAENPKDKLIKSIDFSADGMNGLFNTQYLITFVRLNPDRPTEHPTNVIKYGSGICKFLNPCDRIIHTSTFVDDNLRLFNIPKNGYDIYFKGHNEEVTGLEISPNWQMNFVSASKDKTVKFWDIREENCIRSRSFTKCPIIASHPKELQVAVAYSTDKSTYVVEIYDFRKMNIENAVSRFYAKDQEFEWKVMKFSNNGKYLMVSTNNTLTIVINVDSGELCHRLYGYNNKYYLPIEACFTPDSNFVIGGSQDGKVHIWNMETSEKEKILEKSIAGSTNKIIFNPVFMCFATAGEKFHLWIEKE